jgi:hypothetical protein
MYTLQQIAIITSLHIMLHIKLPTILSVRTTPKYLSKNFIFKHQDKLHNGTQSLTEFLPGIHYVVLSQGSITMQLSACQYKLHKYKKCDIAYISHIANLSVEWT